MLRVLESSVGSQRSEFAYNTAIERVGDLGLRAALFRHTLLIVIAACLVVAADGGSGPLPWLPWVFVAIAALGAYVSMTTNWFQMTEVEPTNRVARLALEVTRSGRGEMLPADIAGWIEFASYWTLAVIGPYLLVDAAPAVRLVVLGSAMAYVASCLVAILTDPAFYNPHSGWSSPAAHRAVVLADSGRAIGGPVAALIAYLVCVPFASWPGDTELIATVLCAGLAGIQLRIREVDRIYSFGSVAARFAALDSRKEYGGAAHRLIGDPVRELEVALKNAGDGVPDEVHESFAYLSGGFSDYMALESRPDKDFAWPGLLEAYLERLAGRTKFHPELVLNTELSAVDQRIAHDVLHNLASNAVASGPTTGTMTVERDGAFVVVTSTDDGAPVHERSWMRADGGLQRLDRTLRRTLPRRNTPCGVRVVGTGEHGPKVIEARWRATEQQGTS
ncbi:hypothetical protein GCM10023146_08120 [Nocardioides caricicola]